MRIAHIKSGTTLSAVFSGCGRGIRCPNDCDLPRCGRVPAYPRSGLGNLRPSGWAFFLLASAIVCLGDSAFSRKVLCPQGRCSNRAELHPEELSLIQLSGGATDGISALPALSNRCLDSAMRNCLLMRSISRRPPSSVSGLALHRMQTQPMLRAAFFGITDAEYRCCRNRTGEKSSLAERHSAKPRQSQTGTPRY